MDVTEKAITIEQEHDEKMFALKRIILDGVVYSLNILTRKIYDIKLTKYYIYNTVDLYEKFSYEGNSYIIDFNSIDFDEVIPSDSEYYVENINIDYNNAINLFSINGVLYIKQNNIGDSLVLYPPGNKDDTYIVPYNIYHLNFYHLRKNKYLHNIKLTNPKCIIYNKDDKYINKFIYKNFYITRDNNNCWTLKNDRNYRQRYIFNN